MISIFLSDIDSPQNLVTEQVTENTATVSWAPVQAVIDRYLVRYTSADGDSGEVPVGKEQSSTVLTGLRPGVEYTVHVWAQKGDRESRKADTKAPTGTVRGGGHEPFTPNRRLPSSTSSLRRGAGNTVLPLRAFFRVLPFSPFRGNALTDSLGREWCEGACVEGGLPHTPLHPAQLPGSPS